MHPYFFSLLYRERLAYYEREAEYRRQLPKRERHLLERFGSLLPTSRRRTTVVTGASAGARPCH